jgi:PAS domain S-box-containing protein
VDRLRRFCAVAAALSATVGGVVFVGGWSMGIDTIKSVFPGFATMKANTALCFVLCGAALWRSRPRPGVARTDRMTPILAVGAATIAALTIVEELTGQDLGLDEIIFRDPASSPIAQHPGRMSPFTAVCFMALGAAIALLDRPRFSRVGAGLAVAAGLIGGANTMAYIYGVDVIARNVVKPYTEMALHTSITMMILSAGVAAARPGTGVARVIAYDTLGGEVARLLWPAVILGPTTIGAIQLALQRAGYVGLEVGLALMVAGNVLFFGLIVWWVSERLHRSDGSRRRAEAEILRANAELEERVRTRTAALAAAEARYRKIIEDSTEGFVVHEGGEIKFANAALARLLGYDHPSDLVGRPLLPLIAPEFRDEVRERVAARLRGEAVSSVVQMEALKKDGSRLWIQGIVSIVEWEGVPSTLVGLVDISDRRRREAAERHAAELEQVAQLAHAAAHEINNPLAILLGSIELVRGDIREQRRLEAILEAIGRIRDIVGRMTRITRLEQSELGVDVRPMLDLRRSSESGQG